MREGAPDLWSIRALVLEVPGWREEAPGDQASEDRAAEPVERLERRRKPLEEDGGRTLPAASATAGEPAEVDDPAALLRRAEGLLLRGHSREAISAAAAAVTALERTGGGEEERRLLPQALTTLARAEAEEGDGVAAVEHLRRAHELRRREELDRTALEELELWGDLCLEMGDLAGAEAAAVRLEALSRRLLESYGETPQSLRDLSVSLNKLGDVQREGGDLESSLGSYEESLALRRRLLESYGETPQSLRDLAVSLDRVGDVQSAVGDLESALGSYEESLALSRRLLESYGETPQSLRDLSVSLERVGDVQRTTGGPQAALTAYREALDLDRRRVERYTETPQALDDLAVSLRKVVELSGRLGERVEGSLLDELAAVEERLTGRRLGWEEVAEPEPES